MCTFFLADGSHYCWHVYTKSFFLGDVFICTVTFLVKSLDLVFFEIEIANLSRLLNFKKEVTIVLNRFSHRLVKKKRKN